MDAVKKGLDNLRHPAGFKLDLHVAERRLNEDPRALADGFLAPPEARRLRAVEAFQVRAALGRPQVRLHVAPVVGPEHLGAEGGQTRVVFHQFRASVHVVVEGVVLAVVVEPVLNAFGPIFGGIRRRVRALPKAAGHGALVGGGQAPIEVGRDGPQAHPVDRVGELVNEEAFLGVRIAGIAEQVLLAAAHRRPAQAARAPVPEDPRGEAAVLGHVGRVFVPGHHRHAPAAAAHRAQKVLAPGHHVREHVGRLAQGEVRHLRGADDGEARGLDMFPVEVVELELRAHGIGHGAHGPSGGTRGRAAQREKDDQAPHTGLLVGTAETRGGGEPPTTGAGYKHARPFSKQLLRAILPSFIGIR